VARLLPPRHALASKRVGCRPWEADRRETHRSGWDHPRQGDDGKLPGPDGEVTLSKRAGFLNADVEDGQPAELRCAIEQWAGGEQMAGPRGGTCASEHPVLPKGALRSQCLRWAGAFAAPPLPRTRPGHDHVLP
jgi:hypothetical protein